MKRVKSVVFGGAILSCLLATATSRAAGVWSSLRNPPPVALDTALLLTDGTVIVHAYASSDWWRLSPDPLGSYVNGAWSQAGSLPPNYAPLYFASAVLPDGRVVIEGGEFNGPNLARVDTNLGAIFDPSTGVWSPVQPPPAWSWIGDAPSVVLSSGAFMLGSTNPNYPAQATLNPATLTWTLMAGPAKRGNSIEEGWTLLPGGNVLAIDVGAAPLTELFDPTTGGWSPAGITGQSLIAWNEIGGSVLLPDGRVFAIGGGKNTGLRGLDGSWSAGPDLPAAPEGQLYGSDAPATLLPNGRVLFAASAAEPAPSTPAGVRFLEFDGMRVADVGRAGNAANDQSFYDRFLLLPTGEVLITDYTNQVVVYQPSGVANPAWAPAISSMSAVMPTGTTQTIAGTQFNGLSQAVAYGDDAQAATNYPLVRITNSASGVVRYAKTHGHSTMAVATGSLPVSTIADIPSDIDTGPATLQVVANGIASAPRSVCIASSVDRACSSSCGARLPDGCGGTVTCPSFTGAACCTNLGGQWVRGRCSFS